MTRHVVENSFLLAGTHRRVDLYRPPMDGPHPLLVVFDGGDFQHRAKLVNLVDNLVAEKRLRPVAMAMVHNGGQARGVEYACSEATLGLLLAYVLPLRQRHLDLLPVVAEPRTGAATQPGPHGVMGASMGGLLSLFAGLRLPAIFGHVLSLSGAFTLHGYDTVVWDLVRYLPVQPVRAWLGVGRYEWLLEPNRRMRALMVTRGYKPAYHVFNAGHNYPAWRDHLWRGLEHLFSNK
ncbi:MAG: esterase family protein [Anaerolineae bacterium]|nr:esterase family protein [Anaerolineae bacterium]